MEHFANESWKDWNGPKCEEARAVCRRIACVLTPANTSMDVIESGYSEAIAEESADCLVNYMYPVDTKRDEY
jgi:hypothetical protein